MLGGVRALTATLAVGLMMGAGAAVAERAPGDHALPPAAFEVSFQILRNGSPIGEHRYNFVLTDSGLTVTSTASATVTMLGMPVYRFEQSVREVWRDGRLVALDAQTDDNGDRSQVTAKATAAGLVVDGPLGRAVAAPTAVPTTYWNFGTVQGAQLIDTRDGEVMSRHVAPLAWERIVEPDGRRTTAQRYRIFGRRAPCDVWYDARGVWHRAMCETEHGRIEDVRLQVSGDRDQFARVLAAYRAGDERLAQREAAQ